MARTFDYAKHADECSLRAATAANDQAREVWREMEAYWRRRIEATAPPAKPDKPVKRSSDHAPLPRNDDRVPLAPATEDAREKLKI